MRNDSCSLWFHPRGFVENNIKYRIASGAAIAKYKHSQAFLLSELSFNPFHDFSKVAKEVLLLKYDIWFDFLCEVEQFLLVAEKDSACDGCVHRIIQMSDERVTYYEETMKQNPDIFNPEYLDMWLSIHAETYKLLVQNILDLQDLKSHEFFSKMTEVLINTMNHTLYELQEIDVLFFSEGDLQFNYDSVCCDFYDKFDGRMLIGETYDKFKEIRDTGHIIIKQYSDVAIPFSMTPLKAYLDDRKINYTVI